jgi:hypothetical protein
MSVPLDEGLNKKIKEKRERKKTEEEGKGRGKMEKERLGNDKSNRSIMSFFRNLAG